MVGFREGREAEDRRQHRLAVYEEGVDREQQDEDEQEKLRRAPGAESQTLRHEGAGIGRHLADLGDDLVLVRQQPLDVRVLCEFRSQFSRRSDLFRDPTRGRFADGRRLPDQDAHEQEHRNDYDDEA